MRQQNLWESCNRQFSARVLGVKRYIIHICTAVCEPKLDAFTDANVSKSLLLGHADPESFSFTVQGKETTQKWLSA